MKRVLMLVLAAFLAAGCAPRLVAEPSPEMQAGIVDKRTTGWPRQVRDAEGNLVEVRSKPMRIHTLSIGFDEITMRLVGPERFAAIGTVATNPLYSNIAEQAKQVPLKVGRKSEDVIAARPDIVLASPFANKDLVRQLRETGLTVVVSDLQDSLEGHAANIRFLAYLFGEEEKGEALIREVQARLKRLDDVVGRKPAEHRPRVIRLTEKLNTPGASTTMDGIIRRAGGVNVAAEAGLERWQQISLEKVVELKPDVIIITETEVTEKKDWGKELLSHPSLQNVPAIRNRRVYALPDRFMSTLSHWNVRGAEELAKRLWPDDFKDVTFRDFD